jgi:hypothetical protein
LRLYVSDLHLENRLLLILLLAKHHCLVSRGDGIIILLSCLFLSLHLSTHLFLAHLDLELAYDEIRVVRELKNCLDLLV